MAPQLHFEAQQEARQWQQTTEFKKACQLRACVEGTISQAAYVLGDRQSRYQGTEKRIYRIWRLLPL
ncbi:MAG: transposase [Ardenticatenaceae bacterium]|nr:transposase [Ardenticatenaceae bacterium]